MRIFLFTGVLLGSFFPAMSSLLAEDESINPGINDRFLDAELDPNEWVERFEVESREVFRERKAILKQCGIRTGSTVADIGSGTGLFTRLFAEAVGADGHVFAVDISPSMVSFLAKTVAERNVSNVTPVLGAANDVLLPRNSCDFAYICDTYHHFEYPSRSLQSLRRALKPGGRLIVIDFERIEGVSREWTLGHVRAGKSVFKAEIEQAGFEFVNEHKLPGLEENYFLVFINPSSETKRD